MIERGQAIIAIAGAAGAAVAVAVMELASFNTEFPLVMIPVGLLVLQLTGPGPWAAAVAVGLAMVAMHATRTFHPPAGIDPLVVVVNDMPWTFLIAPVGVGALLLAAFAFAWHNLLRPRTSGGATWPARWW